MSRFNLIDLDKLLVATLTTDLGSNVSGVFKFRAPDNTKISPNRKPLVIVRHFLAEADDTFTRNGMRVIYQIEIYDHMQNGDAPLALVWDLIYGNSVRPNNTSATTGLHRRKLETASPSTNDVTSLRFLNAGGDFDAANADVIGYYLQFECYYGKNTKNEVLEPEPL